MMRLAVVILNWNGAELLRRFLPGVVAHSVGSVPDVGVDVVVVDNGSTDSSEDEAIKTGARFVRLGQNYGFAGGYNRGLGELMGEGYDCFLLLNSDVEVTPGWIGPLAEAMRRDGAVGAVMPKIRMYDRPEYFEYAGAAGGFIDRLGFPFCRGRVLSRVELDQGQYDTPCDVFWTSGAAMLVRASVWGELGGFDEAFFAHQEEIDLCWRMKRRGWKCRVEPRSVVYHVGGGTLPVGSPRKSYLNVRNNLAMLYKNLKTSQFAWVYAVRLGLDGMGALGYAVRGRWGFAGAVLRGHRDFWRMRRGLDRGLDRGRGEAGCGYIVRDRANGVYGGSIVLRYLLGARKAPSMLP